MQQAYPYYYCAQCNYDHCSSCFTGSGDNTNLLASGDTASAGLPGLASVSNEPSPGATAERSLGVLTPVSSVSPAYKLPIVGSVASSIDWKCSLCDTVNKNSTEKCSCGVYKKVVAMSTQPLCRSGFITGTVTTLLYVQHQL